VSVNDRVKRSVIASAIIILAVAGGATFIVRGGAEPSLNGHRLTFWLEQYTFNKNPQGREAARNAIRGIGTNGLPVLLTMLAARDSPVKSRALKLSERQSFFHLTSARQYRLMARNGFQILGRMAQPAVPTLNKLANDPDEDIRRNAVYSFYDTMGGADFNARD
jgi:hypothetical protein